MRILRLFPILITGILMISCSGDDKGNTTPVQPEPDFIRGADISFLPEIESTGTLFYNNGQAEDVVTTLKNAGANYIRLRLWKDPSSGHSNMAEVKTMAERVRQSGLRVWLTVHYSDTWADPGKQTVPVQWSNLAFPALKNAMVDYTEEILSEIHPDIFQIGNETNDGFLWPIGKLSTNEAQYLQLVAAASAAIRSKAPDTKIMLHYAGIDGSEYFFNKTANIDFDYIGLSYYPIYHGKVLDNVRAKINELGAAHNKKVIIAETSYPFTLGYADYTNNTVGLENQLIPEYPATPEGQKQFLLALRAKIEASTYGKGICYWGTEWIAYRGDTATNGSNAENQAIWDFNHNALPGLSVFAE